MFLELVYVETSAFFAQVRWSLTRVLSRKDRIPHKNIPNPLTVMQELKVQVCTCVEGITVEWKMKDCFSPSLVMTDRVQRRRRVFHSKEEVQSYLPELGEGVSIFICYAPDPESPYLDPQRRGAEIRRNEMLITMLTADLEQHGFHVVSDLHLGDTEPRNWLRWYISRIHLCDFIILVCSPAFNELFSQETLCQDVVDHRAVMFRTYSQAIYDEIAQDVTRGNNTSKFIPVILDRAWEGRENVPSLFRGGFVYNLSGGSVPRRFVYGNRDGGFERLVCRMAGINRVELDKPRDRMLHMLPKPDERGWFLHSWTTSKPIQCYHQKFVVLHVDCCYVLKASLQP